MRCCGGSARAALCRACERAVAAGRSVARSGRACGWRAAQANGHVSEPRVRAKGTRRADAAPRVCADATGLERTVLVGRCSAWRRGPGELQRGKYGARCDVCSLPCPFSPFCERAMGSVGRGGHGVARSGERAHGCDGGGHWFWPHRCCTGPCGDARSRDATRTAACRDDARAMASRAWRRRRSADALVKHGRAVHQCERGVRECAQAC